MAEPLLVADIGGTNARFALAAVKGETINVTDAQTFRAEDFETIRDAADAYLESIGEKPKRAAFAVAGPVGEKVIAFTNSPWVLDIAAVQSALKLKDFRVVNDFHALAAGLAYLADDAFVAVKSGAPDPEAPQLVIGPGTGLGQALIIPTQDGRKIIATEGGHVSFAPRTEEEIAVMQFIAKEHPRVSVERLLSGRGLVNIHRALCVLSDTQRAAMRADEITKAALEETHPMAKQAIDMFCAILGRVAGDAVLATGARGGVILGGGILPKIQDLFLKSAFVDRFTDKGRMTAYVDATPVKLIIKDGAALAGAAAVLEGRA